MTSIIPNNGVKTATYAIPTVVANNIVTFSIDISSNPSQTRDLKSYIISSTPNLVPIIMNVQTDLIEVRLRNVANSQVSGASITVFYA